MAIVLTRFSPGVLTAAQLNAIVDAITAKFNGGITTGDILFPLLMGGNIDMSQFEILHLYKFWQSRNLAERSSTTTLQNVLDEVNTAGGGIVLLPANSTETVGTGGVTVGANTIIMGQGEASVFATSGTLTNHMFRNKANGNAGIAFVNVHLNQSGAGGGAFDVVGMTRTNRLRLVDCIVTSTQSRGVSLLSDSAGSSCLSTRLARCTFNINSNSTSGLFMQDVQRVSVNDCEFNVTASSAAGISGVALGATSNMESIVVSEGTKFVHSSGTGQTSISITGPATTGIKRVHILGCTMSGGGTNARYIDVDAGVATVKSDLKIQGNSISGGSTTAAGIRVRNCMQFHITSNTVEISGAGIGILIGATARSGSAATCRNYNVANNQVSAAESAYVFCHPGSGSMFASVQGNIGLCSNASFAEYEIWNLLAHPTTQVFDSSFDGNMVDDGSASLASFACYTGVGSTRGGRAGSANNSNLLVNNNNVSGTVFGTVGANDDFFTPSEPVTKMYSREGNVGT